jgi:VanZ family protein
MFRDLWASLAMFFSVDTLLNFGFWFLITFVLRKQLAKWFKLSSRWVIWVCLSLAAILSVTLRIWVAYNFSTVYWLFSPDQWSRAFHLSGQWVLNAALFAPAGFALVLAGRKPGYVILGLALLSFSIETLQFWARSGIADPADLVANVTGAVLGTVVALASKRWFRRR